MRNIWLLESMPVRLWVYGNKPELAIAYHRPAAKKSRPSALLMGSPLLASNFEFGCDSNVAKLALADSPDAAVRVFEDFGAKGFALLEGEFSLVIADPANSCIYLAVDKYGCTEIFFRRIGNAIAFASDCALVMDAGTQWDSLPVAFFLAQTGFVPGPYTLSKSVESVARASCIKISWNGSSAQVERRRYWRPGVTWNLQSTEAAEDQFFHVIESATAVRADERWALLLSSGVDSSLLLNVLKRVVPAGMPPPIALTGAVKGFTQFEEEVEKAASLALALEVPHSTIILDPADPLLPEEWALCTSSMTGTRVQMPLFYRFGDFLRERIGEGYSVLSGQMADTIADNNYTLPSFGYTLRRAFCSPWFLFLMPWFRRTTPSATGFSGRGLGNFLRFLRQPRLAGMLESVFDGMQDLHRFYDGRLFGFGEMPGRAPASFPSIRASHFDAMADWYSSQFIAPALADITPDNFYRNMIELNMDMVMLHLDTRTVFQTLRLAGGSAQLPFLDSRVVNFFCSLPYSARAFWHQPKLVIRSQFARQNLLRSSGPAVPAKAVDSKPASVEQLLLNGSIGDYFRELLGRQSIPDRTHGLFEVVDERYFFDQIQRFRSGSGTINHGFITRLAALEYWNRGLSKRNNETFALGSCSEKI